MEIEENCQSHDPDALPYNENSELTAHQIQKKKSMN